jgi:hypothetical protein
MSDDRSTFRPSLEALEDRCQPSTFRAFPTFATAAPRPMPNLLPAYIYNPLITSSGGQSFGTAQQAATPAQPHAAYIFNPFVVESGFSVQNPGGYGTAHVFNPYLFNNAQTVQQAPPAAAPAAAVPPGAFAFTFNPFK